MTKIGKTMITVKGEIHPVEIHYNRERKFFYRGVPDEVIALSSFRNRDYASEKELTQALSIALEQYHEKIKVQRKMILYTLLWIFRSDPGTNRTGHVRRAKRRCEFKVRDFNVCTISVRI